MRSNKIKSSLVAIKLTNLFHCSSSLINFIATKLDLFYYFLNLLTLLLPAKFYCFPNFIAFQIFKIFLMIVFIMDPRDPFQTLTICKTRWTKFNLIHQSKFMNRIDITYFYKSLNWMFINFDWWIKLNLVHRASNLCSTYEFLWSRINEILINASDFWPKFDWSRINQILVNISVFWSKFFWCKTKEILVNICEFWLKIIGSQK